MAFRARVSPRGLVVAAIWLSFGWKFSPYLCQRILGDLLRPHVPAGVELLHYLDDFVPVSVDMSTGRCLVVRPRGWSGYCAMRIMLFHINLCWTRSSVCLSWGFFFNRRLRIIYSHRRAWLQVMSAWLRLVVAQRAGAKLMEKLLGFLQWHILPWLTAAPLFAGVYCWIRWGDHSSSVPLKNFHSLAPVLCLCAEPYQALPWERARPLITLSVSPGSGLMCVPRGCGVWTRHGTFSLTASVASPCFWRPHLELCHGSSIRSNPWNSLDFAGQ